jgi:plasmid stabilization system protein ParE
VAHLSLAPAAQDDLDRLHQFLADADVAGADAIVGLVLDAIAVLERHPLVGRSVEEGRRELVISRGRSGYVALYRYFETEDTVMILAIRHQREAGYNE